MPDSLGPLGVDNDIVAGNIDVLGKGRLIELFIALGNELATARQFRFCCNPAADPCWGVQGIQRGIIFWLTG